MDRPPAPARPCLAPALAPAVVLLLLGACSCPDLPELQRLVGVDLATPDNAVRYFLESAIQGSPWHEYIVISEAAKDDVRARENVELTMHNYSLARDRIIERVREHYGDLDDIEVAGVRPDPARPGDPTRALVDVTSGRARGTVLLVQETAYAVTFRDPRFRPVQIVLRDGDRAVAFEGGDLVLRLALEARPAALPADVYRITFERAWKILGFEGAEVLRGLDEAIDEAGRALREPPRP